MRRRFLGIALAAAAALSAAALGQPAYSVQKVGDGIWAAQPANGANVGWFLLGNEVVVVDSGPDAASAKFLLEKIAETAGKPVRYLIITHAHGDNAGGASVFAAAGARIIADEHAATGIAGVLQRAESAPNPFLVLSERLSFVGGPRRVGILWLGAGHSASDLVIVLPDDKVLFTGDLVTTARLPFMQSPDCDPKNWEKILPRLAALDADRIVPGHGDIGPRQGIADTLAYVRKVNSLAKQFIQQRIPDELFDARLRDPDNRIEHVAVTPDHVANVRAVVKREKAALEKKPEATPTPRRAPAKK
jgi:glyoxylase-like metal-dependent hydrolase (beta-lactamase superfamily II)